MKPIQKRPVALWQACASSSFFVHRWDYIRTTPNVGQGPPHCEPGPLIWFLLLSAFSYYPHFPDEKTGTERLSKMPNAQDCLTAKPGFELRYFEPEHFAVCSLLSTNKQFCKLLLHLFFTNVFSCQQMQLFNINFSGYPMTHFAFTKVRLVNILEAISLFSAQKRPFWVKGHTLNHSWNV